MNMIPIKFTLLLAKTKCNRSLLNGQLIRMWLRFSSCYNNSQTAVYTHQYISAIIEQYRTGVILAV
jgi:hypothetical protein